MSNPARYPKFSSADSSRTRVTLRDLAKAVDVPGDLFESVDLEQEAADLQFCALGPMLRNADPETVRPPKQRNFLLIRRAKHRPGRMHRKAVKTDNRAVPLIIVFSSFLALAMLYVALL